MDVATPNFDRIDPSQCFNAKLRRLHRMINSVYMQQLRPFDLRGSMLSILFIVGKNESINQKSLAEALILDQSTMSRDIRRMMAKGWVKRKKERTRGKYW